MSQLHRRTVVRGAAWSLPVVVTAAQAPAYAASTDAPRISGSAAFVSCKQPGGPNGANCQGYRVSINLTVQPDDTWDVVFTDVKLNSTSYTASTSPLSFAVSSGAPGVAFVVCTQDNSQGPVTIQLSFTATNRRTGVTTATTGSYDLGVVNPCKP